MNKIKTENDLLGFMIKNADKYNDFNVKILTEKFGSESLIDFHCMIKELEIKRYVSMTCLDIIHICPLGYKEYISPFKSKYFKALPLLKLLCSTLVGIAAGNATKIYRFIQSLLKLQS